ncbi:hypothetical protein [Devosia sp. 2618]|uniref:hypothetical protein n=1 Tax=Devosia sp. 2618 TaxID=3156454 RepID=UPI0033954CE9
MLERFYVNLQGPTCTGFEGLCGLTWLVSRPEERLYIQAPKKHLLESAFEAIAAERPSMRISLTKAIKQRTLVLNGRTITIGLFHPTPMSLHNGAVLTLYPDSKQMNEVEERLAPVGAVCALPWVLTDIGAWIAEHSPHAVSCTPD